MAQPTSPGVHNVVLLYYSLTGNTRHIAELLRDTLNAQGFSATTMDITGPGDNLDAVLSAVASADAVGVGGLAIGLHEPLKVRSVLEALPESSVLGKPAIVFGTAGGNEGRLLPNMANALTLKGAVVVGSLLVYAPSNNAVRALPKGARYEWGSSERNKPIEFAKTVAPLLRERPPRPAPVPAGTLSGNLLSWFVGDGVTRTMTGRISVDKDACIKCHLCVRQCPSGALDIEEADGLPRWNEDKCTGCCRCINHCPKGCISSPRTAGKQQYRCKREWFVDGDFTHRVIPPPAK
eukprot:m51a1_g14268 putative 4fe-4s ferredoxin (293) ;mRNA; f:311663-312541